MTDDTRSALVKEANQVLKADHLDQTQVAELITRLEKKNLLGYARRLLERLLISFPGESPNQRLTWFHKLAVCTYKDPDLPVDHRLRRAESMLSLVLGEPGAAKDSPEAVEFVGLGLPALASLAAVAEHQASRQQFLGLAGAVQKRRWETYGVRKHLLRSERYYRAGFKLAGFEDSGYTGINLAFVLDLLADTDDESDISSRRKEARRVREQVVTGLLDKRERNPDWKLDWWTVCTFGEAYLGLGDYAKAQRWMKRAYDLREEMEAAARKLEAAPLHAGRKPAERILPWQLETAVRQVARLARIRAGLDRVPIEASEAWEVVGTLLGETGHGASSFLVGKVGLALSGGGFRASFFHIGVLARLAELDVLRHVEVLSCVSGGSIVGAHYYLELRQLLKSTPDRDLNRQEYINLVERVRGHFVAGVGKNLCQQMLFGWRSNLRVLFSQRSSISERLADLYEKELFSKVKDGEGGRPRFLADLTITPDGSDGSFDPRHDNWTRRHKVPILILNATTLNTCHNWQFTASYMGEAPSRAIESGIDNNDRLRRVYHSDAPGRYQWDPSADRQKGVRLGEAVAASACVPGLFPPLVLDELYGSARTKDVRYIASLVDGGTYDNQGIASLREQDCTVLLVSDACGQTEVAESMDTWMLPVLKRTNDILMMRVREAQFQLLANLREAGVIQGLFYVHLKRGLDAALVDWIKCDEATVQKIRDPFTSHGIRTDMQLLLSGIRTDIDAFSKMEADALMFSGYEITRHEWRDPPIETTLPDCPKNWDFLGVKAVMTATSEGRDVECFTRGLEAGSRIFFKPYWLVHPGDFLEGLKLLAATLILAWGLAQIPWLFRRVSTAGVFLTGLKGIWVAVDVWVVALIVLSLSRFRLKPHLRRGYLEILFAWFMCTIGFVHYPVTRLFNSFHARWGSAYRNDGGRRQTRQTNTPPDSHPVGTTLS